MKIADAKVVVNGGSKQSTVVQVELSKDLNSNVHLTGGVVAPTNRPSAGTAYARVGFRF